MTMNRKTDPSDPAPVARLLARYNAGDETLRRFFSAVCRERSIAARQKALAEGRVWRTIAGQVRGSKLDPHRQEIERLLRQGVPIAHVAERFGVRHPTVIVWLRRRGIEFQRRRPGEVVNRVLPHQARSRR